LSSPWGEETGEGGRKIKLIWGGIGGPVQTLAVRKNRLKPWTVFWGDDKEAAPFLLEADAYRPPRKIHWTNPFRRRNLRSMKPARLHNAAPITS